MPTEQRPKGSAGLPQRPRRGAGSARIAAALALSLAAGIAALSAGIGSAGAMGLHGSGGWNGPPRDSVYHGQPASNRIGTRTGSDGTAARHPRPRIVVVPPRENPPRPPGRPHRPHRPIIVEFPSPAAPVGIVGPPPAPVATPAASRGGGGASAIVAPATGERRFVPDEVLVSFASNVSPQAIVRFAQGQRLALLGLHRLPLIDTALYRFRITDRRAVPAVLGSLRGDARIGAAQPNYLYTLQQAAQQAAPESLAGDPAQYVVAKLHLAQAHALATGGHVLVALIDSAIDDSHPELQGVLAGRFDAIKGRVSPHAHGTAMASAIAAHGRLLGVAPAAHLLAVRAFDGAGAGAQSTTTRVLDGLQWAADSGARVVNMSFTGPADAKLHEMIAATRRKGLVLVAAAGNDGPQAAPDYPAAYPEVIAVTATDAEDRLLKVANHGAYVSVAAPGVDIFVAAPEGRYGFTTGTSVATAHVSGLAALLIDRNPDLTPEAVQAILTRTAKHLASGIRDGRGSDANDAGYGAGLVDAYEALLALAPATAESALGH
ncbi:MAG TPA: S8 family serine peptidase [Xanthobacteraceae bacterium]|nr:S8 family serine peptidase [Xanthobacteraceae bacterium]